jgi:ATP-dependent Clp protease ATP-binding subunit ClpC
MLKPALSRGEIQCIGATTLDEYRKNIEKDGALERRFQKIMVEPTTPEETLQILNNIKGRYEDHHNVTYTDDALEACVKLTDRYISDRNFPDKAIDALDEAGARVHVSNIIVPKEIESLEAQIETCREDKINAVKSQNYELAASFRDKEKELQLSLESAKANWERQMQQHREIVNEEKVAEVVAMMTGVPVQRIAQAEGNKLLAMSGELKREIIGQDDAVDKIVKAIQRNRVGLKDPGKPIGTFMFLGPTGVGKTHLAKKLAEYLFDSKDALIRIDMSEYMEKFTVSRLVGAPPGYVGYEEGGMLVNKIRQQPYAVVLFDEIEKAHPSVYDIFLQIMDEGKLHDRLGKEGDFSNSIVLFTSNVGSEWLTKQLESGNVPSTTQIMEVMGQYFRPEFLARLSEIVPFSPIREDILLKIFDIQFNGVRKLLDKQGIGITITDDARKMLAHKGFTPKYGARQVAGVIRNYLRRPISRLIINEELGKGKSLEVGLDEQNELTWNIHQ